jgi:hypothetical protein
VQTTLQAIDMAHVIQLSVAPVFLLSGIGAMLSVLGTRVGRIIDRSRLIEGELAGAHERLHAELHCELALLSRRARLANWAITLCTACALLVCTVIAALFIGASLNYDTSTLIALLFITAMAVLIAGLVCFLQEIYLATANLRIGLR